MSAIQDCLYYIQLTLTIHSVLPLLFQACIINKAKCQGEDAQLPCNICDGQSLCSRGKIRCLDAEGDGETMTKQFFIMSLQLQAEC